MNAWFVAVAVIAALVFESVAQCSVATTTSTDGAGLKSLESCSTFTGAAHIQGPFPTATLHGSSVNLTNLESVEGDLVFSEVDPSVSGISAPQLRSVAGALVLINVSTAISFEALSEAGTVALTRISTLDDFFGVFPKLQKCSVLILNDTSLESFSNTGHLEDTQSDFYIQLVSNTRLNEIVLVNMANCPLLDIHSNGNEVSVRLLNTSCSAIPLHHCAKFEAPDVVNVSQSAWTRGLELVNGSFTTLELPKLAYMDGMNLQGNYNLEEISFASLEQVNYGGMTISENVQLSNLALPKLSTIEGVMNVSGVFENLSTPVLSFVLGEVELALRGAYGCSEPNTRQEQNGFAKAMYSCTENSTSKGAADRGGDLSVGDKVGIGIGVPLVVSIVLALIWAVFTILRYKRVNATSLDTKEANGKSELDGVETAIDRLELSSCSIQELPCARAFEIGNRGALAELPAKHGVCEAGEVVRHELEGQVLVSQ